MIRVRSLVLAAALLVGSGFLTTRAVAGPESPAASVAPSAAIEPQAALGTGFSYQGQLKKGGSAANATCNFQFSLWDAPSGGNQRGSTATANNVGITNGLFNASLNFGAQFTGEALYLQVAVKCPDDASFVTMSTRQALSATPYALGLMPGSNSVGNSAYGNSIFRAENTGGGFGVTGASASGIGVYGVASATSGTTFGVAGNAFSPGGYAVYGYATAGTAVRGDGQGSTTGVWANSSSGYGLYASSISNYGAYASSSGGVGLRAVSSSNIGVQATAGSHALWGQSGSGLGAFGKSTSSNGMQGESSSGAGVYGAGYVGVQGQTNGGQDSQALRGENGGNNAVGWAGIFNGRTFVVGNLSKSGGSFTIDHPLDPANKILNHSFVESPDMKNIYDGVEVLDANGEATVKLPDYFEALNKDFRYQLTCVGGYAPVYVSEEIKNNEFKIAGGKPGLKVSWQVTGTRQDAYANANRIVVEEDKTGADKGTYLNPAAFGQPAEKAAPFLRSGAKLADATAPIESKP